MSDKAFEGTAGFFDKFVARTLPRHSAEYRTFPGACPRRDNESREPGRSFSLFGTSATRYGYWLRVAAERAIKTSVADERIVLINSWNKWADGAYLERDRHHGYAYLVETRWARDGIAGDVRAAPVTCADARFAVAQPSKRNLLPNSTRRACAKIVRKLLPR